MRYTANEEQLLCVAFCLARGKNDTQQDLRGEPRLKHMVPAAARYTTIICVRFFRAPRGKTAHEQKNVPLCRRQKSRLRKSCTIKIKYHAAAGESLSSGSPIQPVW